MKKTLIFLPLLLFSFWGSAQTSENQEVASKKERLTKQKIKVFPNPATNVVNILGLFNSNKARISIADISGNIVQAHQWAIRNNALSIPIPNLKSGIYMVHIHSKEQQVRTKFYKN